MIISAGKCYRTRDGRKVGPMIWKEQPSWASKGYWDGIIERNAEGKQYFPGVYNDGRQDPNGIGEYSCDLIAEWPSETSPVRLETRKVIVPGVYGVLEVGKSLTMPVQCGSDEEQPVAYVSIVTAYSTATELRAAAAVLNELAEALE